MGKIKAFWNMEGQDMPEWLQGRVRGAAGDTLVIDSGKGGDDTIIAERGEFVVAGSSPIIHVVGFELYYDIIHPYVQR
jgi:hypothetical protein